MIKRLYAQFAAWVTQFKNKIRTDAFFAARFQLMGLYLIIGALIFMLYGWVLGAVSLQSLYEISVSQDGHPVDVAFALYQSQMLHRRFIMAALFAVSAYFFTEFALKPVKKASDLQKRFVATVSHELRTPLTIMKNASEVALRNPDTLSKEKAVRVIEGNLEEINRLSDTIQFLLTFSLLRTQKRIPEMQHVRLDEIISKTVPLLTKESDEQKVKLLFLPQTSTPILGNSVALEGLVINLVKNAIDHTPEKGTVKITLNENKSQVILIVADTGGGIEKKELPYIFEPFYRGAGEDRKEKTYKGFGLGLSIVKEIAEFHQASITVNSTVHVGTTVTVAFPK